MKKNDGDGKKTTVSPGGLIKKSFWFHPDEARRLRKEAYEKEVSQAELVRRAVRQYFGMDEPKDPNPEGDTASELRADPTFRDELRALLEEHASTTKQAEELLALLESRDEEKSTTDDGD